jgi:hypothetical protein
MINKRNFNLLAVLLLAGTMVLSSCKKDEEETPAPIPTPDTYSQEDQMGRPAINTVFVTSADKDDFNMTIPSEMGAEYQSKFETQLLALNAGYTTNLLGFDAPTFTGALASDVLTVATSGPTTFYDGTNVLTGRALTDDVITVELILIFGGPDATANPGLTDDNVSSNDKNFLGDFPYLATPH